MAGFGFGVASVQIVTDQDPGGPMDITFISTVIRTVRMNPDSINFLGPNHNQETVDKSLPVGTTQYLYVLQIIPLLTLDA
jgi:hypothetical protein